MSRKTLIKMLTDPDAIRRLLRLTEERFEAGNHGVFPKSACAATCSMALRESGFDVPFEVGAQRLAERLMSGGWTKVSSSLPPEPGDVFVCKDWNNRAGSDHIGIVAGVHPQSPNLFMAVDNHLDKYGHTPYARNIPDAAEGRAFVSVDYWLRSTNSD